MYKCSQMYYCYEASLFLLSDESIIVVRQVSYYCQTSLLLLSGKSIIVVRQSIIVVTQVYYCCQTSLSLIVVNPTLFPNFLPSLVPDVSLSLSDCD